jgi:hypothetical protein
MPIPYPRLCSPITLGLAQSRALRLTYPVDPATIIAGQSGDNPMVALPGAFWSAECGGPERGGARQRQLCASPSTPRGTKLVWRRRRWRRQVSDCSVLLLLFLVQHCYCAKKYFEEHVMIYKAASKPSTQDTSTIIIRYSTAVSRHSIFKVAYVIFLPPHRQTRRRVHESWKKWFYLLRSRIVCELFLH